MKGALKITNFTIECLLVFFWRKIIFVYIFTWSAFSIPNITQKLHTWLNMRNKISLNGKYDTEPRITRLMTPTAVIKYFRNIKNCLLLLNLTLLIQFKILFAFPTIIISFNIYKITIHWQTAKIFSKWTILKFKFLTYFQVLQIIHSKTLNHVGMIRQDVSWPQ